MRFFAAVCVLLGASAHANPLNLVPNSADVSVLAPLVVSDSAVHIKDKYIVVFKDRISHDDVQRHQSWVTGFSANAKDSGYGVQSVFSFETNFQGYVGKFTDEQLAEIRSSGDIAYVEKDQIVYINDVEVPAPWGLSRLTSRTGVPDDRHYEYEADAGDGVTAYIVDTGINIEHVDFEGRAIWGKTIPDGDPDRDDNGHGTHVAGTVGGKKYGVAKKVKLVAVKVLRSSGSGTLSDVVKGIEYVLNQHTAEVKKKGKARSVANMSLGGGKSPSLDRAVDVAVDGGVHFAVAAGNDNQDACNYSPAASAKAITVGATNINDEKAYFSNYGRCVNILAPGQEIESTWIGSKTATNTISGTSMASPHVAGAVAALLTRPEWADLSPSDLRSQLVYVAGRYYIKGLPRGTRTPNRMLFIPAVKKE